VNIVCVAEQIGEAVMEVDKNGAKLIVRVQLLTEPGQKQHEQQVLTVHCPQDQDLANDIADEVRHGTKLLHLVALIDRKGFHLTHLTTKRYKLKVCTQY
jgi:hypothetical protein